MQSSDVINFVVGLWSVSEITFCGSIEIGKVVMIVAGRHVVGHLALPLGRQHQVPYSWWSERATHLELRLGYKSF